jgi:hypothetical protein
MGGRGCFSHQESERPFGRKSEKRALRERARARTDARTRHGENAIGHAAHAQRARPRWMPGAAGSAEFLDRKRCDPQNSFIGSVAIRRIPSSEALRSAEFLDRKRCDPQNSSIGSVAIRRISLIGSVRERSDAQNSLIEALRSMDNLDKKRSLVQLTGAEVLLPSRVPLTPCASSMPHTLASSILNPAGAGPLAHRPAPAGPDGRSGQESASRERLRPP